VQGPPVFDEPLHVGRPTVANREKFLERVNQILDSRWFTNDGPMVREFEAKIAEYLGVRNCVATCNGTVALELAYRALGFQGEVIVPSFTFVATVHALHWQGITPIFCDIDPATHNIDPLEVERLVTEKTTGIVGVHLWGRPCAIDALQGIASRHRLELVFDAAHAFGCSWNGTKIGNFGRCEVLSFHATKFLHSFEGGAIATNDDELAEQLRLMRNFGFAGFDNVIHPGVNGKMIEVCAAMGLTNLECIDELISANHQNYLAYKRGFDGIPGVNVIEYDDTQHPNYQYMVIEVADNSPMSRDEIVRRFHAENVLVRRYFWPGCHNMMPYRELFPFAGLKLSNTNMVANRVISMPTGPAVTNHEIEATIDLFRMIQS
jgi:dTDP-4-amino-4,6-dideoxygalactose transaminase